MLIAEDGDYADPPTGVTVAGNCDMPTGACCEHDTGVCTDGVSIFDCTYEFSQDENCAELFPPCGSCYDAVISAPGSWSGDTCDAANNCTLRWSHDRTVQVIIPSDGYWAFSLCGATWDTYLYVGYDCCTNVWSNNDSSQCTPSHLASRIELCGLPAGTYYATIEGNYSSACGPVTLTVEPFGLEDRDAASSSSAPRTPEESWPH